MRIVLCLLALVIAPAWALTGNDEGRYLCIASAAGGVRYDKQKKSWKGVGILNVRDRKYTLSKQNGIWQWNVSGKNFGLNCDGGFTESGVIRCGKQGIQQIAFNKKTMRFQEIFTPGYIDGIDDNKDTPVIIIGTCRKI